MNSRQIVRYIKTHIRQELCDLYHEEKHGAICLSDVHASLKSIIPVVYDFYMNNKPETKEDQLLIYFLKSIHIDIQLVIDDIENLNVSHKDLIAWLKDLRHACNDFIIENTCIANTCDSYSLPNENYCARHVINY